MGVLELLCKYMCEKEHWKAVDQWVTLVPLDGRVLGNFSFTLFSRNLLVYHIYAKCYNRRQAITSFCFQQIARETC